MANKKKVDKTSNDPLIETLFENIGILNERLEAVESKMNIISRRMGV